MSGRHVPVAELELYVLGALDAGQTEALESHCTECDACAAALAGEASLEIAFEQVAKRAARVQAARPLRAVVYGAAGVIAMAAAVLLWIGRAPAVGAGEGTAAVGHAPLDDGAILDARNDALDGG